MKSKGPEDTNFFLDKKKKAGAQTGGVGTVTGGTNAAANNTNNMPLYMIFVLVN